MRWRGRVCVFDVRPVAVHCGLCVEPVPNYFCLGRCPFWICVDLLV